MSKSSKPGDPGHVQDPESGFDPAFVRGLTQSRLSRQAFLRGGAASLGMLALGAVTPALAGTTVKDWGAWWKQQEPTKELVFANWPLYIDVANTGPKHPSLADFTKATGIDVKYLEVIQDIPSFYAKIAPVLRAGQPTGYDLAVITDGWPLHEIFLQGWAIPLWHEKLPNFKNYASSSVVSPSYDPGNKYTLAWQSGFTGIGYNPKLTKREITSIDDLWDPAFAGHVGMMTETDDFGSMGLLKIGVVPAQSTPEDWQKAAKVLLEQRQKGIVRQYYDQSYITALENGDTWISMAWSGDIYQAHEKGYKDLKFVVPKEGAPFWHDNMLIPIGAKNPLSALAWMNFYYTPKIAGIIEDYIAYICPVPAAKDYVLNVLKDPAVANSPLVFPTAETYKRAYEYPTFKNYGEYEEWTKTFNSIIQS